MATILLSIKPEYVERIFNGSKKYEFRKYLTQEKVEKIEDLLELLMGPA